MQTRVSVPPRKGAVTLVTAALVQVRYADGGMGTIPASFLGGTGTGLHARPRVGDQVLVFYDAGQRASGAIPVTDTPGLLPTLNPGETAIIGADGRVLAYPKNDGTTTLYSKPAGTTILVDATGNVLFSPATGQTVQVGGNRVLVVGDTAGGDLTGTYPNPTVAPGAITASKIANGTITTTQISASAGIVAGQIASVNASSLSGVVATANLPTTVAFTNVANTFSSSQTFAGGTTTLSNATSNLITFGTTGIAAPATTGSLSAGTKVALYNDGTAAGLYALGISSGTLWACVPVTGVYKWYVGPAQAAPLTLDATGFHNTQINTATLRYVATSDLASAVALTAGAWKDVITGGVSFTVNDANSLVEIAVSGCALVAPTTGTGASIGSQLVVDTTAYALGGTQTDASKYVNALAGAGLVSISGLAAGAHTLKVQVACILAATLYCRPSSFPLYESLRITVTERRT